MILGLDISTSITGVTILDESGKIILNETIDMRKINGDLFSKAEMIEERFEQIKKNHTLSRVFVEQSLSAFRPGLSSASVILTLGRFNGIVSWIAYKVFGLSPEYIPVQTARKTLGIKVERGQNAKEIVLKHLLDTVPDFPVEYTPKGNPKAGVYDRADSYVIAKAGLLNVQGQKA